MNGTDASLNSTAIANATDEDPESDAIGGGGGGWGEAADSTNELAGTILRSDQVGGRALRFYIWQFSLQRL